MSTPHISERSEGNRDHPKWRKHCKLRFLCCPRCDSPQFLHVLQVADEDLVVHGGAEAAGPEEVNTVKVGDVHTPAGREGHTQGCSAYWHLPATPHKQAETQIKKSKKRAEVFFSHREAKLKAEYEKCNVFVVIFVCPFKVTCSPTVGWLCAPELKCKSQMAARGGTWCLEGGSPSHTPARASQRSTRPPRRSPQTQTELWYGKGRTLTSHPSPQTCRGGQQEGKKNQTKCQLLKQYPTRKRGLFSTLFLTP